MFKRTEVEVMQNWLIGDVSKPVVSICCTTYNHVNYISEALDGFLMQETDFSFEIIVRDDASSDGTADIIKMYEEKFPHIIKAVYETHNGFNAGIKPMPTAISKAQGQYIALCEGDDYWTDPKKLQIQKDFLEQNHEYVICYGDVEAFNENGKIKDYIGGVQKDLTQDEMRKSTPINTPTVMFRNVIESFPLEMRSSYYGDLFIWSVLGNFGQGKYIHSIKPSRYRIHDGGIHSSLSNLELYTNTLVTYALLMSYNRRIKNSEIAHYFKVRIIYSLLQTDGLLFITKSVLKEYSLDRYNKFKQFVKKILIFLRLYQK